MFWAGNFVLARAFSVDIPPITLASIRWTAAFLILLPFALPAIYRHWHTVRQNLPILCLFSVLSVAGFNTLAYIGLQYTTAVNGTLMQSSLPIMILLLSTLVLKEAASLRQWAGVFVSLLGVLILISRADFAVLAGLHFNPGDLWVLFAMLVWGCYSIVLRWRPEGLPGFTLFSVTLTIGVLLLAPLAFIEMQDRPAIVWDSDVYMLIAYLAVFPSILAYMFWNYGIEKLGARSAGLFIHLVPLWGMLLSVIFLGETLYAFHFWGIVLIFVGIYFAVISDKKQNIQEK